MTPPVTRATAADTAVVTALLTRAFLDLPPSRWAVPDPARRHAPLRAHLGLAVEHGLGHGHVDLLGGPAPTAAAVWLPYEKPDTQPPPLPDYASRLRRACGPYTDRFRALDEAFDACRPDVEVPHHYLTLLGVDPDRHRRGLGTAVLRHHHTLLDAAGLGAFLVAAGEPSRDFYTANGYTVLAEHALPDDGPTLYPMWRDPDPTGP